MTEPMATMAHWPWQEAVAGLLVVLAAAYVGHRYAPASLRRELRSYLARISRRLGWGRLAARIEAVASDGAACGTGCASCQSCGPRQALPSEPLSGESAERAERGEQGEWIAARITPAALRRTIGRAPGFQSDAQQ